MNRLPKLILIALLGAAILIVAGTAIGQPAAPASALRTTFPDIDPKPDVSGANYTVENFQRLQAWSEKYAAACLILTPRLVDRPVYSLDGNGAANAVIVVPMSSLERYRAAIERGDVVWIPLAEAVDRLKRPPTPVGDPDAATAAALERYRQAVGKALAILSQP
jgi:hypothetical protein